MSDSRKPPETPPTKAPANEEEDIFAGVVVKGIGDDKDKATKAREAGKKLEAAGVKLQSVEAMENVILTPPKLAYPPSFFAAYKKSPENADSVRMMMMEFQQMSEYYQEKLAKKAGGLKAPGEEDVKVLNRLNDHRIALASLMNNPNADAKEIEELLQNMRLIRSSVPFTEKPAFSFNPKRIPELAGVTNLDKEAQFLFGMIDKQLVEINSQAAKLGYPKDIDTNKRAIQAIKLCITGAPGEDKAQKLNMLSHLLEDRNLNLTVPHAPDTNENLLHLAVQQNNVEAVKAILGYMNKQKQVDVVQVIGGVIGEAGTNPYQLAVAGKNQEIISLFDKEIEAFSAKNEAELGDTAAVIANIKSGQFDIYFESATKKSEIPTVKFTDKQLADRVENIEKLSKKLNDNFGKLVEAYEKNLPERADLQKAFNRFKELHLQLADMTTPWTEAQNAELNQCIGVMEKPLSTVAMPAPKYSQGDIDKVKLGQIEHNDAMNRRLKDFSAMGVQRPIPDSDKPVLIQNITNALEKYYDKLVGLVAVRADNVHQVQSQIDKLENYRLRLLNNEPLTKFDAEDIKIIIDRANLIAPVNPRGEIDKSAEEGLEKRALFKEKTTFDKKQQADYLDAVAKGQSVPEAKEFVPLAKAAKPAAPVKKEKKEKKSFFDRFKPKPKVREAALSVTPTVPASVATAPITPPPAAPAAAGAPSSSAPAGVAAAPASPPPAAPVAAGKPAPTAPVAAKAVPPVLLPRPAGGFAALAKIAVPVTPAATPASSSVAPTVAPTAAAPVLPAAVKPARPVPPPASTKPKAAPTAAAPIAGAPIAGAPIAAAPIAAAPIAAAPIAAAPIAAAPKAAAPIAAAPKAAAPTAAPKAAAPIAHKGSSTNSSTNSKAAPTAAAPAAAAAAPQHNAAAPTAAAPIAAAPTAAAPTAAAPIAAAPKSSSIASANSSRHTRSSAPKEILPLVHGYPESRDEIQNEWKAFKVELEKQIKKGPPEHVHAIMEMFKENPNKDGAIKIANKHDLTGNQQKKLLKLRRKAVRIKVGIKLKEERQQADSTKMQDLKEVTDERKFMRKLAKAAITPGDFRAGVLNLGPKFSRVLFADERLRLAEVNRITDPAAREFATNNYLFVAGAPMLNDFLIALKSDKNLHHPTRGNKDKVFKEFQKQMQAKNPGLKVPRKEFEKIWKSQQQEYAERVAMHAELLPKFKSGQLHDNLKGALSTAQGIMGSNPDAAALYRVQKELANLRSVIDELEKMDRPRLDKQLGTEGGDAKDKRKKLEVQLKAQEKEFHDYMLKNPSQIVKMADAAVAEAQVHLAAGAKTTPDGIIGRLQDVKFFLDQEAAKHEKNPESPQYKKALDAQWSATHAAIEVRKAHIEYMKDPRNPEVAAKFVNAMEVAGKAEKALLHAYPDMEKDLSAKAAPAVVSPTPVVAAPKPAAAPIPAVAAAIPTAAADTGSSSANTSTASTANISRSSTSWPTTCGACTASKQRKISNRNFIVRRYEKDGANCS